MGGDDGERRVHGGHVVGRAPIAGERGIEHFPEPVDDDGMPDLTQDAVVDGGVIVRAARDPRQRPAGHQDDTAVERLDRLDLRLVGGDDVVERSRLVRRQMVGAGAASDACAGATLRLAQGTRHQLAGAGPVEAHAALRRIHRLGDAEAQIPKVVAERERFVPIDPRVEERIAFGQRIHDHMGCGIGDPVEHGRRAAARRRRQGRVAQLVAFDRAVKRGKRDDGHGGPTRRGS